MQKQVARAGEGALAVNMVIASSEESRVRMEPRGRVSGVRDGRERNGLAPATGRAPAPWVVYRGPVSSGRAFEDGCWVIRTSDRLRFELHWSLPLFPIATVCWTPLSFLLALLLLGAHEVGHAIVVRWRGLTPYAIRMHSLGGHCLHEPGTPLDSAWIAWGGVAAQLPFLGVGLLVTELIPTGGFHDQVWVSLVFANGILIVSNLLPIGRLDGAKAWTLPGLLWSARASRRASEARWKAKDRAMWDAIESAKRRQSERSRRGE